MPHVEISEMSISQSVECPLTVKDTAIISGQLSSHNGTGSGTVGVAMRRILGHAGWAEVGRDCASFSCDIKKFWFLLDIVFVFERGPVLLFFYM